MIFLGEILLVVSIVIYLFNSLYLKAINNSNNWLVYIICMFILSSIYYNSTLESVYHDIVGVEFNTIKMILLLLSTVYLYIIYIPVKNDKFTLSTIGYFYFMVILGFLILISISILWVFILY